MALRFVKRASMAAWLSGVIFLYMPQSVFVCIVFIVVSPFCGVNGMRWEYKSGNRRNTMRAKARYFS
jgi:hypothetical protein